MRPVTALDIYAMSRGMTLSMILLCSIIRILQALQESRAERKERAAKGNDLIGNIHEGRVEEKWMDFWKKESPKLLLYSCIHGTVEVVKYFQHFCFHYEVHTCIL